MKDPYTKKSNKGLIALLFMLSAFLMLVGAGCGGDDAGDNVDKTQTGEAVADYNPRINAADFVDMVDNKYYPLTPGTTFVYESDTEDGRERNEVAVTDETKEILGINCTVVHDRVWLEGDLIEETYDWYAQDREGNVWYLGEDSKSYENSEFVSAEGSWEAGKDGAMPGFIMKAVPQVGDSWRQEFLKGEAEDWGEIIALDESITVPAGSYQGCVRTRDWTPLEAGIEENKIYCPGAGVVLEEMTRGGSDKMLLVELNKV